MTNQTTRALENHDRFAYARDHGHLDFIQKAEQCDAYFVGEQWDEAATQRLNRLKKPIITVNKVLSACASVFGEQLSNRADVSFRPVREGTDEVASALDKTWLFIASSNNLNWLESEVAADGFIRGRGFYDLRVSFDDHMMGEADIRLLNSKSVVIDPDAESYDPDDWKEVFVTKWLTADDVSRLYGDRFGRELEGRPQHAFSSSYDTVDWTPDSFGGRDREWGYDEDQKRRRMFRIIERQFKEMRYVDCFVDVNTGDMREIPSEWDRERIEQVRRDYGLETYRKRLEGIRWTASIDNILLHNEPSPLKHFTPVPYFPYFRHGKTIGIVENMISPQDLLNKSISQELHIINTTANSGWKIRAGALANMTVEQLREQGGEDGLVIETTTSTKEVEKIQPNQVPTGIDRLSYKADEALKEVSMVSDSMRGMDRADVAAKAIQAKTVRGTVSLAKPFENLGYTRYLLARNTVDVVQTFYTETRVLQITGSNLTDKSENLTVNQVTPEGDVVNDLTAGEYTAVIGTVPARETYEQSQFGEALELRQLGIAIPDDVLVEHSHLNRKGEIAERIRELNGGAEPSQTEQRMAELDMQLKELEAAEKEADIQVKQSNAQLNQARAASEAQESGDGGEQEAELLRLAMEREKMLSSLQLEREKVEQELKLEWRKFLEQQQLERAKMQGQLRIDAEKVENDKKIAERKATQDAKMAKEKAKQQPKTGASK